MGTETRVEKPWLLIDVDGVLNVHPNGQRPDGDWAEHVLTDRNDIPYRLHLNPLHGEWLNGLSDVFDLAWATTWTGRASIRIAPLIGLPVGLPHVPLPDPRYSDHPGAGYAWKTPHVHFWLAGRSAAWIDDDVTTRDGEALMTPGGPNGVCSPAALAVGINPNVGLTCESILTLRDWAEALS